MHGHASAPPLKPRQPSAPVPVPGFGVPLAAVGHLGRLRGALSRYRETGDPAQLELAFSAAGDVAATMIAPGRPDLERVRELATSVPELGALASCAADAAERALRQAMTGLWDSLALYSDPPTWTESERDTARMVLACAWAPGSATEPERLRRALRAIAATRVAALLCDQLSENEAAWRRVLGGRYESVRHRCARRTTWRRGGLAALLRADAPSRRAVAARLERWLADGAARGALPGELEAALVHCRTPARLA